MGMWSGASSRAAALEREGAPCAGRHGEEASRAACCSRGKKVSLLPNAVKKGARLKQACAREEQGGRAWGKGGAGEEGRR